MKKIFLISILLLFCIAGISGFIYAEDVTSEIAPKVMSKPEIELRSSMRTLWEARAILLRAYIVSAMNDSKDTDEARDKLLKNAGDLGSSINPYYGSWAGSILAGFLKKDVWLTEKVIEAAKKNNKESPDLAVKAKEEAIDLTKKAKEEASNLAEESNKESPDMAEKAKGKALGLIEMAQEIARNLIEKAREIARDMAERANKDALDQAKERWYGNARDLAGFFAIPHNQTKKDLTDMLCKHLDLTWGEIDAMLKKDKGKDLDYYEKDRAHMIMFSDVLVNGLVKRFPDRFKD